MLTKLWCPARQRSLVASWCTMTNIRMVAGTALRGMGDPIVTVSYSVDRKRWPRVVW